ncbi:hypothetical protein MHYP_G00250780 [Metynnis hypsauchen]
MSSRLQAAAPPGSFIHSSPLSLPLCGLAESGFRELADLETCDLSDLDDSESGQCQASEIATRRGLGVTGRDITTTGHHQPANSDNHSQRKDGKRKVCFNALRGWLDQRIYGIAEVVGHACSLAQEELGGSCDPTLKNTVQLR